MNDSIVQEVRETRAALAADFNFDLHQFFAWAKTHGEAERKANSLIPMTFTTAKPKPRRPKPGQRSLAKPSPAKV